MSVAVTTAPSPGWYPDPQDAAHLRWWDGESWTSHVAEAPQSEPDPAPILHVPFVADLLPADVAEFDDEPFEDPIEFSWGDTIEAYVVTIDEPVAAEPVQPVQPVQPEPEPEPEPEPPLAPLTAAAQSTEPAGPFAFRARSLEPAPPLQQPAPEPEPAREIPVYESPLATISSPLPERVEVHVPVRIPVAEPQAQSAPAVDSPPPPPPPAPAPAARRSPVPAFALTGSAGLIVVAAAAATITNLLSGDEAPNRASVVAAAPITTADRTCLKEWNTTASGTAAELRVTLGQFTGAHARVARVAPLPGTLMAPDSCALTVYDPATDTNAVFVSGVKDQLGYMDVTSYPRAETYGWPKSQRQANVSVREDGSIRAL